MFFYAMTWRQLSVILATSFQEDSIEKIAHLLDLRLRPIQESREVDLLIEKSGEGYTLTAKWIDKIYRFTSVGSLIVHVVNLISTCFLYRSEESILHSGALMIENQAILFSGLPHAGKSSLALHAWLQRHPIINDDLLLYDEKRHTISSFPKPMKPRLPSLEIPSPIVRLAGVRNLTVGNFLHDIGLFIGKRAEGMVSYDEEIPVRALFFIERGLETKASPVSRMQALVLALTQVMPNGSSLKVGALIDRLDKTGSIYHLTIADHDQKGALNTMRNLAR